MADRQKIAFAAPSDKLLSSRAHSEELNREYPSVFDDSHQSLACRPKWTKLRVCLLRVGQHKEKFVLPCADNGKCCSNFQINCHFRDVLLPDSCLQRARTRRKRSLWDDYKRKDLHLPISIFNHHIQGSTNRWVDLVFPILAYIHFLWLSWTLHWSQDYGVESWEFEHTNEWHPPSIGEDKQNRWNSAPLHKYQWFCHNQSFNPQSLKPLMSSPSPV